MPLENRNPKIYMDYAATSFIKDEVFSRMLPFMQQNYGNPSAIYSSGRIAKNAMEEARHGIAKIIGARVDEIYFTSGGTESNNWALSCAVGEDGGHIITSRAEHHSILESCEAFEKKGGRVTFVDVDCDGQADMEQLDEALNNGKALVSLMYANNEVGTINNIKEIARLVQNADHALLHVDAVAAVGHLSVDVSGIDMMSISAHKFYGPKGVGALYVRKGTQISPLLFGGQQERGRRAGTENVAGTVGMAVALELATQDMAEENARLQTLRDYFEQQLAQHIQGVRFNSRGTNRLCNYVNICLPGIAAKSALVALDMAGVECSSGSACSVGGIEPSHVLLAMGLSEEQARRALRFTLGASNTQDETDRVVEILSNICQRR